MVDTVNFRISQDEASSFDFLSNIPPILEETSLGVHDYNGFTSITGYLGNLGVKVTNRQLTIYKGSLCKWYVGDNYQSMKRADIKHAVEKLSDILHLPMERAVITRLDVGLTISVKYPVPNYTSHLGELKHSKRMQEAETLYYQRHNKGERLCFYDKNLESRNAREQIPDLYKGTNVLRYEQRYLKNLPKLLREPKITGGLLYKERFYEKLLTQWLKAYQEIRKVNEITLNFKEMTSIKQLNQMGILSLVERAGGELALISLINEACKRGEYTSKQAYDLRQAIKEACKLNVGLTVPAEEISELDKKIINAIRFFR